jgi:hypothetical protein
MYSSEKNEEGKRIKPQHIMLKIFRTNEFANVVLRNSKIDWKAVEEKFGKELERLGITSELVEGL